MVDVTLVVRLFVLVVQTLVRVLVLDVVQVVLTVAILLVQ